MWHMFGQAPKWPHSLCTLVQLDRYTAPSGLINARVLSKGRRVSSNL